MRTFFLALLLAVSLSGMVAQAAPGTPPAPTGPSVQSEWVNG